MPHVEFAFLADAAEAEPGRKFYVLGGGVDSIGAPGGFPIVHPHLALLLRVLVHPAEADRPHAIEIKLMDSDGAEMAKVEGNFEASGWTQSGREIPMSIVLNFMNTRFEHAGDYSFEILLNNQHQKSLPLHVHQVEQPPSPN